MVFKRCLLFCYARDEGRDEIMSRQSIPFAPDGGRNYGWLIALRIGSVCVGLFFTFFFCFSEGGCCHGPVVKKRREMTDQIESNVEHRGVDRRGEILIGRLKMYLCTGWSFRGWQLRRFVVSVGSAFRANPSR